MERSNKIVVIKSYFNEILPKPKCELNYNKDYELVIAVMLSAQTTDKKVNEVTPELFRIAPSPAKMIELGEDGITKYIRVISFFNNKAKSIIGLSERLMDEDNNSDENYKFPKKFHNRDALMKLPGIGQKTANVIMNVLWNAPNIGVDTHVFRLSHRFGWADDSDNTPEKVEEKLLQKIPKKYHAMVNHVMVLHGRYTCKALKPKCAECPVARWCNANDKII